MVKKRKIVVVSGTRAEYGILSPVLEAIKARPDLELLLVVIGMHLSREFGYTVAEIEKSGQKINARVAMLPEEDTTEAMAASVGTGILGMVKAWKKLEPEIVIVFGDRVEQLAAAIAGAYMNLTLAHVHGGDVCGNIDDAARHAITRFAHIHFPATKTSADRILRMGEEEWRVHTVGSPAIDNIIGEPLLPIPELEKRLGLDFSQPVVIILQHPVTAQITAAPLQMRETLEAVVATGHAAAVIYPNSDAGGRSMIEVIREYEKHPLIKAYPSLPRREYLSLMKAASVLVGNSSSGLVEAPSLGLPAVNIGLRQAGRERGDNIIGVAHDRREIMAGIDKALTDEGFLRKVRKCRSPYGDGKTGPRIAEILSRVEITPELILKRITY